MMEWMRAHPWMTFFLLMAVIETVGKNISAVCTAVVSCQGHKSGEATDISDS